MVQRRVEGEKTWYPTEGKGYGKARTAALGISRKADYTSQKKFQRQKWESPFRGNAARGFTRNVPLTEAGFGPKKMKDERGESSKE